MLAIRHAEDDMA